MYRSLEDYLTIFSKANVARHLAIGEGSVYMMYAQEILDEILNLNSSAKFVIMLRNPYLAAISMHGQNLKSFGQGREPKANFAEAWADLGKRDVGEIAGVHSLKFRYDVLYSYSRHVKAAISTIGARNLKLVFYDDFKKDNLTVAKSVYEFLGVDCNFNPEVALVNARSQSRNNLVAKGMFWAARNLRRHRIFRPLRGRGYTLNPLTQQGLSSPEISADLMRDMRIVFQDDIRELQRLVGRSLDPWLETDLVGRGNRDAI
jgi:hypothetical protein